jgi:hypothetical protein
MIELHDSATVALRALAIKPVALILADYNTARVGQSTS